MGMATGIFVVDTHVHAQRHAFKFKEKGIKPDYAKLGEGMTDHGVEVYDNSARLLYHMDRYKVDVAVIQPAFAMTNEINAEIVRNNPDRFIAMCNPVQTYLKASRGEEEWTLEAAVKELDEQLSTGLFKGIGEGIPFDPKPKRRITWEERWDQIKAFMDLARKYKVPVSYHTGIVNGYGGSSSSDGFNLFNFHDWGNPLLAKDIALAYPDVTIILAHGGIQGSWTTSYWEQCMHVAACCPNVYLEAGLYWADLYEKAFLDPNIGPEKLIWGTDWGASLPIQWMPGQKPATFADQSRRTGPPSHQVDLFGWALREIGKLDVPQDDLNLVLGGNACEIFDIKPPHTRLFKEYLLK